jgi:hypothetical protein
MNELLEARITDLNSHAVLLLFAMTEEVIERFAKSVCLILKNLRVDYLESIIAPLDLRYLFVKIEASETFTLLFVRFLTL